MDEEYDVIVLGTGLKVWIWKTLLVTPSWSYLAKYRNPQNSPVELGLNITQKVTEMEKVIVQTSW